MPEQERYPLRVTWSAPSDPLPLGSLGGFRFCGSLVHTELPLVWLDMPVLGSAKTVAEEWWCTSNPVSYGQKGNIKFSITDDFVFGVISLDENSPNDLSKLTTNAYSEIFEYLRDSGFHQIWRLWNHFSNINSDDSGLERYRQFNIGRQIAFDKAESLLKGRMPAASAVGVKTGPLVISFLAGKALHAVIENPDQVSAFEYPEIYGPQSPSFSRAAVVPIGSDTLVLVSGTASIKGHLTTNLGNPYEQTLTAFENIQIVTESAGRQCCGCIELSRMFYRVYVRNAEDYSEVQRAMLACLGDESKVHYVQADICRDDLLVEIEATGYVE